MTHDQGIQAITQLDAEQLQQIRELEQLCNVHDGITLKLNWEMLENRADGLVSDWIYTEDGRIVAFLGLYVIQPSEGEISGMVHPDYRRHGLFTRLLQASSDECRSRGIPKQLLIVQRGSQSGQEWVKSTGGKYSFSEYWMELSGEGSLVDRAVTEPGSRIGLRKANDADFELLVKLDMLGFGGTESDARAFNLNFPASEEMEILIAELDGLPIGKLRLTLRDGGFLSGFSVLPDFRGQGCGREILAQTIQWARSAQLTGPLALEVAASNAKALGLYTSVGFEERSVNDYYERNIS